MHGYLQRPSNVKTFSRHAGCNGPRSARILGLTTFERIKQAASVIRATLLALCRGTEPFFPVNVAARQRIGPVCAAFTRADPPVSKINRPSPGTRFAAATPFDERPCSFDVGVVYAAKEVRREIKMPKIFCGKLVSTWRIFWIFFFGKLIFRLKIRTLLIFFLRYCDLLWIILIINIW